MAFWARVRGRVAMLISGYVPLIFGSTLESPPYNVAEGCVLPLLVHTNLSGKGATLNIRTSPVPTGVFTFQRIKSTFPSFAWEDVALEQTGPGEFIDEPGSGFMLYRLKHFSGQEIRLSSTVSASNYVTNRTVEFPLLAGWTYSLQALKSGETQWRSIETLVISNSPAAVPGTLAAEEVRILARPPIVREDYEAIFVGGQSNATPSDNHGYPAKVSSVVYLDNQLRFRNPAQFYDGLKPRAWGYSFAMGAATALSEQSGTRYLLIPVAVGGTSMTQWMPSSNRFDRSTFFGRANFFRVAGAPQPIRAIWYYGHESSTGTPELYIGQWKTLMAEFQKELGSVPIIFAQLAKSTDPSMNSYNFLGAEQQRFSEAGQGLGTPGHHMVVTFDLPLGDGLHLSGEANRILGLRFARAMRQHVYGEDIDGTGPRLSGITHPNGDRTLVQVTFTQEINESVNRYDDQFTVSDSDGELNIAEVNRTNRGQSVLLRLERNPNGIVKVSYGAPKAAADLLYLPNVVRNMEGLPAPAFGPQAVE